MVLRFCSTTCLRLRQKSLMIVYLLVYRWHVVSWVRLFKQLVKTSPFHHLVWHHVLGQTICNCISNFHTLFALPDIRSAISVCSSDAQLCYLFTFGPHITSCQYLFRACLYSLVVLDSVFFASSGEKTFVVFPPLVVTVFLPQFCKVLCLTSCSPVTFRY